MAFTVSDFEAETAKRALDVLGEEDVTYYPYGGNSRAIKALVDRDEVQPIPGTPHGISPGAEITVRNDSTYGISSSELDKNLDKISYAIRIGEVAQSRKIIAIVSVDNGMMTLRVA